MNGIAVFIVLVSACFANSGTAVAESQTTRYESPQNTTPQEPAPVGTPAQPAPAEPAKPKEQAPKHVSTGWSALFRDTAGDFKHFPLRQSTWVILGIGGGAALAT